MRKGDGTLKVNHTTVALLVPMKVDHIRDLFRKTCFNLETSQQSLKNMSAKHLGSGSRDVPLQEGKLRLYSMRFCPYAQRTHLVLNAKGIPHDVVNIDLKDKPKWYLDMFPAGKVPAIKVDGVLIYESLILSEYLEEKYPEMPLWPKDPLRRAQDRLLIDEFAKGLKLFYKLLLNGSSDPQDMVPIQEHIDFFEKELAKRNTTFFFGDKPGMVDYMIWPFCERLDIETTFGESKERFRRMYGWVNAMMEDPAVKNHYCTPAQHSKFFTSLQAGTPDYDNILTTKL